jgi:hypothetical protein
VPDIASGHAREPLAAPFTGGGMVPVAVLAAH